MPTENATIEKHVELGRCGEVVLLLSPERTRLLVEFNVDKDGFDKAGLSAFIDALEKIRKKMER